jgi:outer membrane protein assembly factor BamB
LAAEFGAFENRFGHTSSPLLYHNTLIVQCDHYGESYVLAMDTRTGRDQWRVDRPGTWHSWSSPQLIEGTSADDAEVILCAAERVDALRIRDGTAIWTVRGMQRECIPTPVVGHGLLYAVSGPKGTTLAIRPGGRGDVTDSHVVWSTHRGSPFVPSPVLWGDNYYVVDDRGIATCLDAHSGKLQWQKRLPGAFTASPIAGDEKIYFTNENGETIVVAGGATYRELARNSLPEAVYASGALSHGCLFLRTPQHLYCIDGR